MTESNASTVVSKNGCRDAIPALLMTKSISPTDESTASGVGGGVGGRGGGGRLAGRLPMSDLLTSSGC